MPRKAAAPVVETPVAEVPAAETEVVAEVVSNGPAADETPAVPEAAPAPVVESDADGIIDYALVPPGFKGKARTASGAIVEYL